jgi:hypothetical protein
MPFLNRSVSSLEKNCGCGKLQSWYLEKLKARRVIGGLSCFIKALENWAAQTSGH